MSRSFKKNLISKSGRWLKKGWARRYRSHTNKVLRRDQDDINIEKPNAIVNCYDITDYIYFCSGNGNPSNCWCGLQGKLYCIIKNK